MYFNPGGKNPRTKFFPSIPAAGNRVAIPSGPGREDDFTGLRQPTWRTGEPAVEGVIGGSWKIWEAALPRLKMPLNPRPQEDDNSADSFGLRGRPQEPTEPRRSFEPRRDRAHRSFDPGLTSRAAPVLEGMP